MAVKKETKDVNEHQVKIKYIFRDDYNPVYANGAYGGINPTGEIVANFYFERFPLPKVEIMKEDCTDFEPSDLADTAVRFIDTGVILSPQTAEVLAKWLLAQVEQVKKLKSDISADGESNETK